MYSYEARVRADALWLKHGKRIKATLRPLGDPMKHALKAGGTNWRRGAIGARRMFAQSRNIRKTGSTWHSST
ncbi:hypothetical protein MB84_31440 (plasmid) [Pandoraea oxalativorans]|uniref:Uncharacterized protein n=1 Tax=Pandoraea oxalativorans TaxID=573737 RepID=A0A192B170_9BURK|nr:hypothetical protein MB84_31440 [Pandoraea oxalativorans]